MKIRVYYEDTDLGGVVYHSNYLNFCERARSDLFFSKGLSPVLEAGHFVVRSLQADYKKPAKFADVLEVKTVLVSLRSASFTLEQTIYRDDEKLFSMVAKFAYLSHEGAIRTFDEEMKELLVRLFG